MLSWYWLTSNLNLRLSDSYLTECWSANMKIPKYYEEYKQLEGLHEIKGSPEKWAYHSMLEPCEAQDSLQSPHVQADHIYSIHVCIIHRKMKSISYASSHKKPWLSCHPAKWTFTISELHYSPTSPIPLLKVYFEIVCMKRQNGEFLLVVCLK